MRITEPFAASPVWLQGFKRRHGIRQLDIQGEKLSGDISAADLYVTEFKRLVATHDLSPEQIYNADNTGLYWKALPSKTLVSQEEKSAPGHKQFVTSVREQLWSKNLPERAMLLLDNAPSHPNDRVLKTSDGRIFVAYLLPNVTSLLQPMDQGVLEAFKRRYWKALLRAVLKEDVDLRESCKKWTINDAIFSCSDCWNDIPSVTLRKSWRKLHPDVMGDDLNANEPELQTITPEMLLEDIQDPYGFEAVDKDDMGQWLLLDSDQPVYEVKDDATIAAKLSSSAVLPVEKHSDDPTDDEEKVPVKKLSLADALNYAETLLEFLEQQSDSNFSDILTLRKLRTSIKLKRSKKTKQRILTDFFKKDS
jgi:hypothetical protein